MHQPDEHQGPSLKARTAKGLLWSGASNVLQQIFGFVFGIILARVLSQHDYGMVGMVTVFSVIASALQESGFVSGIANKDKVSHEDYNAVFWCSLFVSTTLYIILFFLAPYIALFYGIPELVPLARLSFLSFWVGSFAIAHNAYLFRNLMVKERSVTTLLATIGSGGVGVAMALHGFGYWGLAAQVVVYALTTSIFSTFFSGFRPSFRIDLRPIVPMVAYSSKVLITNIFIHLNNNVFAVILGRFYSTSHVGALTQANKWNLMAQSIVSGMATNITQPVMREVSDERQRQKRVFRKIVKFTAFVSCPLMFGLAMLSEEFIVIAITDRWLESASYLKLLAFGGAFAIISTVFSSFILSQGKSSTYMWSVMSFGGAQLLLLLGLHPYGAVTMIASIAVLNLLWLFVWFFLMRRSMVYTFKDLGEDVFSYAALAIVAMLLTSLSVFWIEQLYVRFFLSLLVAPLLYAGLNFLIVPDVIRESLTFVFRKIRK